LNPSELMLPYDLLAKVRGEIDARLRELQPHLAEYERLLAAADALEAEGRMATAQATASAATVETAVEQTAPPAQPSFAGARDAPEAGGQTEIPQASQTASWPEADEIPTPRAADEEPDERPARRERVSPAAVQQAIVAALEHGSHTVGELVIVTAMEAPDIRAGARRLMHDGKIKRTEREGKAAYALPVTAEA
jgi:hypothetical protein